MAPALISFDSELFDEQLQSFFAKIGLFMAEDRRQGSVSERVIDRLHYRYSRSVVKLLSEFDSVTILPAAVLLSPQSCADQCQHEVY